MYEKLGQIKEKVDTWLVGDTDEQATVRRFYFGALCGATFALPIGILWLMQP